jgi:FkbM family methyltransferase
MILNKLKSQVYEFQNEIFRKVLKLAFARKSKFEMIRIGNDYSGYWFPKELLPLKGTIWGVGLGHDSTFEKEMSEMDWNILGFEPEYKCFQSSRAQLKSNNVMLYQFGLWDKKGSFKYSGDNISIVDIFQKRDFHPTKLEIRSLWEVSQELRLTEQIPPRVLRMNIEGAEREILRRMTSEILEFEIIIFQAEFLFHLPFKFQAQKIMALFELISVIRMLEKLGWDSIDLKRHQITLIKS